MIPPIIHYVWLGTDRPEPFAVECYRQMQRLHPDNRWDFKMWIGPWDIGDLLNILPPDLHIPVSMAWGKMRTKTERSDLFRLCALYVHGGIYVDWDVWPIRSFGDFLVSNEETILGFNSYDPPVIGEHVIGCVPKSPRIRRVLERFCYSSPQPDGRYSPTIAGLAVPERWDAYPPDVFCPHPRTATEEDKYLITSDTYALHCYADGPYDLDRLKQLEWDLLYVGGN